MSQPAQPQPDELNRLDMLLTIIRTEQPVFAEVVKSLSAIQQEKIEASIRFMEALQCIRADRLYRLKTDKKTGKPYTLEGFCEFYCGFGATRARQLGLHLSKLKKLINAANAASVTESNGLTELPENEWQTRGKTPELLMELANPDVEPDNRDGTEGLDDHQILQFVRNSQEAITRDSDITAGGEILAELGKWYAGQVRILGRIDRKCQQRHPSFEEEQDMAKAMAKSLCVKTGLPVPAWACEEPGPTGKKRRAA